MKNKVKKVFLCLALLYALAWAVVYLILIGMYISTFFQEDRTLQAKEEFGQYQGENDVALLLNEEVIYFGTHTLDLADVVADEDPNGGCMMVNGRVCFSTSKRVEGEGFTFSVYECDIYGNDVKLLFRKDDLPGKPSAFDRGSVFYVVYYTKNQFIQSSQVLDAYDLATGEYKNVASGAGCAKPYRAKQTDSRYMYEIVDDDYFKICNTETGEVKIVDESTLMNTPYAKSLKVFAHGPRRMDISKGHLLLSYSIAVGGGSSAAPHLIFEYDFEDETLEYKSLVFPYNTPTIEIEYVQ